MVFLSCLFISFSGALFLFTCSRRVKVKSSTFASFRNTFIAIFLPVLLHCWALLTACGGVDDTTFVVCCKGAATEQVFGGSSYVIIASSISCKSFVSSSSSSSCLAILTKKLEVLLPSDEVVFTAGVGNLEMRAARQQPILCWHFFRLMGLSLVIEYTFITSAKTPSNDLAWGGTKWCWRNPTLPCCLINSIWYQVCSDDSLFSYLWNYSWFASSAA